MTRRAPPWRRAACAALLAVSSALPSGAASFLGIGPEYRGEQVDLDIIGTSGGSVGLLRTHIRRYGAALHFIEEDRFAVSAFGGFGQLRAPVTRFPPATLDLKSDPDDAWGVAGRVQWPRVFEGLGMEVRGGYTALKSGQPAPYRWKMDGLDLALLATRSGVEWRAGVGPRYRRWTGEIETRDAAGSALVTPVESRRLFGGAAFFEYRFPGGRSFTATGGFGNGYDYAIAFVLPLAEFRGTEPPRPRREVPPASGPAERDVMILEPALPTRRAELPPAPAVAWPRTPPPDPAPVPLSTLSEERLAALGRASFEEGRFERALEIYGILADRDPTGFAHRYNRATALYMLGRVEEAAREYEIAALADPADFDARFYLGVCYARLGLAARARAALEAALAIDPGSRDARRALEDLEASLP